MAKLLQLLTLGSRLSPPLRAALRQTLDELAVHAAETPGSTDDQVVAVLKALAVLLGVYG